MVFSGSKLSDFARVSYTNKKSTSKGAFCYGARCFASIGLKTMRNLRGFAGKWTTLYDDRLI